MAFSLFMILFFTSDKGMSSLACESPLVQELASETQTDCSKSSFTMYNLHVTSSSHTSKIHQSSDHLRIHFLISGKATLVQMLLQTEFLCNVC